MDRQRAIVLYGNTLSLAAIGAGLDVQPGCTVTQVDSAARDAAERLRSLRPDVLLFNLCAAQPDAVISLLQETPDLLLIGVDLLNHRALVMSGKQPALLTTGDLMALIVANLDRVS